MDLVQLLFSFRGRANRAKYWLVALIFILVALAFGVIIAVTHFWILLVPMIIFILVSSLAICVKRLHDREKSAWWLVPFYLIPGILQGIADFLEKSASDGSPMIIAIVLYIAAFALSIWAFVELGCLRGTIGDNRYGPDPLAGRG